MDRIFEQLLEESVYFSKKRINKVIPYCCQDYLKIFSPMNGLEFISTSFTMNTDYMIQQLNVQAKFLIIGNGCIISAEIFLPNPDQDSPEINNSHNIPTDINSLQNRLREIEKQQMYLKEKLAYYQNIN
jgi:hypothetical protein